MQKSLFRFDFNYFLLTILLFVAEVCIAVFVHDNFVRPYVGDVLVVLLIYSFTRTFLHISVMKAAITVLMFSFLTEFFQYFSLIEKLGLRDFKIVRTVLGTTFSWLDLLCYFIGFLIILVAERYLTIDRSGTTD